jgi:arsenate reductase (glutaredoxin)
MSHFTIYHNPKCSKSREALVLLQAHHVQPVIIEYLKNPLSLGQIQKLQAHFELKDFVRYKEPLFKELNLSLNNTAEVLLAIQKTPILMQRPIVTYGEKAIIARPMEHLLVFIETMCHKKI